MIDTQHLALLLSNFESDRVERTVSTTDTNKFCEAICAFANDLPASHEPGYLIIGARDSDGKIMNIEITDDLLQQLSNYADSGQIVPFPNQNDYRNPKIAEAMKILGYVNRFGHGIALTQSSLKKNGNPPAQFDVSQPTYFLATMIESDI